MERQTIISQEKTTVGEQIRQIADRLKQETSIQVHATAKILGAAAQISTHHDRLIDEVVEMVEEDLEIQQEPQFLVETLKQQFKTFNKAKLFYKLKARSWIDLANQLNFSNIPNPRSVNTKEDAMAQRLSAIEEELKTIQLQLRQILLLLES
jgi:hypothetical protein